MISLFLCENSSSKVNVGLKLVPDWPFLHFWAAARLVSLGQSKDAEEILREGLKFDAESWSALYAKGFVEMANGDKTNAVLDLQRSLNLAPDNPPGRFVLAEALFSEGKLSEAREHFRTYLQGDTDSQTAARAREMISNINETLSNQQ